MPIKIDSGYKKHFECGCKFFNFDFNDDVLLNSRSCNSSHNDVKRSEIYLGKTNTLVTTFIPCYTKRAEKIVIEDVIGNSSN